MSQQVVLIACRARNLFSKEMNISEGIDGFVLQYGWDTAGVLLLCNSSFAVSPAWQEQLAADMLVVNTK